MRLRALQALEPALVLASGSETRRAILEGCGLVFSVVPPAFNEVEIKERFRRDGRSAADAALALARAKAEMISEQHPEAAIIGADQILSCRNEWFDKPASLEEARMQLGRLSGQAQRLHSAAVLVRGGVLRWSHVAEPEIMLRAASALVLDAYVAQEGAALLTSVGGCRIEGPGQLLIERVMGEHAAVLGLPLLSLLAALRTEGILPV